MRELDWESFGRMVGWRLRCRRVWAGLPLERAAAAAGCHRQTLAAYETDARQLPLWRLMALCELYGVSSEYVLRPADEGDLPQAGTPPAPPT